MNNNKKYYASEIYTYIMVKSKKIMSYFFFVLCTLSYYLCPSTFRNIRVIANFTKRCCM